MGPAVRRRFWPGCLLAWSDLVRFPENRHIAVDQIYFKKSNSKTSSTIHARGAKNCRGLKNAFVVENLHNQEHSPNENPELGFEFLRLQNGGQIGFEMGKG